MKNKGFTLIELLAVIVILAIIAIIATPVILNIIDDAKKESGERSVELYSSAIKNGILSHQLNGNEVSAGIYTPSDGGKTLTKDGVTIKVDYDGARVECTTVEIYENGNIYLKECTVNGETVTYSLGTKQQIYKPQYYSWSSGNIGEDLPTDAKQNVSEIDTKGYPFYLGLDVGSNNKVTAAYVCFTRNGTEEYCLKGDDTEVFTTNTGVIKDAYSDVVDTCSFEVNYSDCYVDRLHVAAHSNGAVEASDESWFCYVFENGRFSCFY